MTFIDLIAIATHQVRCAALCRALKRIPESIVAVRTVAPHTTRCRWFEMIQMHYLIMEGGFRCHVMWKTGLEEAFAESGLVRFIVHLYFPRHKLGTMYPMHTQTKSFENYSYPYQSCNLATRIPRRMLQFYF